MATKPLDQDECIFDVEERLLKAANDDCAETRRWHQSGPPGQESIDATTHFFDQMWYACQPPKHIPDHVDVAQQGHKAKSKDVHERAAAALQEGPRAANAAAFHTTKRRKGLNEPVIQIDHMRLVPDLFTTPARPDPRLRNEVVVLRHERCTFTRKRTDVLSAPGHLAISRHSLERIHERSLYDGKDLAQTILSEAENADFALAFAFAAGIHLGSGRLDRNAATAIPFCDGLLLVQNQIVALRKSTNPAEWQEINRGGIFRHPVAINPHSTLPLPDVRGREMVGYVMPVAATFLAGGMLRPAQATYREWFLRMLKHCREEMPDLASRTAKCYLQHQACPEKPENALPCLAVDDIGRQLLPEILSQRRNQPVLLSIGWTHFSHPSRW